MADDVEGSAKNVAFDVMAEGELGRLQSYMQRGRPFKALGDDEIESRWVTGMRHWAKAVGNRPKDLDDLDAEYKMRQQEAPYHLVSEEVEVITMTVSQAYEAMSDDEKDDANERMMADYGATRKNRN